MWKMLEQYPNSRLGKLSQVPLHPLTTHQVTTHEEIMKLVADYSLADNEYFFDRHPRSFNTILNFYRTGKLHMNEEMCIMSFRDDLNFWMLPEDLLEKCCRTEYNAKLFCVLMDMDMTAAAMQEDAPEHFGSGCLGRYQKCLWDLIEHGESSSAAKVVEWISMMFVVISTIGMCVNTIGALKVLDDDGNIQNNPLLELNELICIIWFSLEYFLRLLGAPDKKAFLTNGLNFVDVLAILPWFVEEGMQYLDREKARAYADMGTTPLPWATASNLTMYAAIEEEGDEDTLRGLMDVFRVFKLARILKLAR